MEQDYLEFLHITKNFPGVTALDDVSMSVHRGEIHALVGENGAGKSTLMNILGGNLQPNGGELRLDGHPVKISSPIDAYRKGIGFVHQESNLLENLSVCENVFLGRERVLSLGRTDRKGMCREIRETSKVPIIMLTAKGEESDELNGFELGVDEYISKPFSPKILVARVGAILRRSGKTQDEEAAVSMGGIVLDKAAHMVTVDGERIDLSYKEFELLAYFMENAGIALSREKILNSVWNYDYFGDARTIDTHVKKLRAKMGDKGKYITTVWGMGYKFEVTEE